MKKPTTIRLSDAAHDALKRLAERDARSMAGYLEKLIQEKAKEDGVWVPPSVVLPR